MILISRGDLEKEADRLGLAWTSTTTESELRSLIDLRQRGDLMAGAAEKVEDGDLKSVTEIPECHGEFWDYPKEAICKGCFGQQTCFKKFSEVTFSRVQTVLGPEATLSTLALELDVSEEAVLITLNHQAALSPVSSALQGEKLPSIPGPVDVTDYVQVLEIKGDIEEHQFDKDGDNGAGDVLAKAGPVEEQSEALPREADTPVDLNKTVTPVEPLQVMESNLVAKKKPAKKKAGRKKKAAKVKPIEVADGKVVVKQVRKKKAAAKAPPVKFADFFPKEAENPPLAESVTVATGSAKKKKSVSALNAKVQAEPPKDFELTKAAKDQIRRKLSRNRKRKKTRKPTLLSDPWGEHTWIKRYERERNRSPRIAGLLPGRKLPRDYAGVHHEVIVLKRFYRYQGRDFPTLYSVVKEITGTHAAPRQLDKEGHRPEGVRQLCNWSAPKFFNLQGA